MIVRELLTKWGFDVDDSDLKAVEEGLQKVKRGVQVVGAVATTAAAGIFGLTNETAKYAKNVREQSEALDITTDKYQELLFTFKQFNADGNDVADMIATISDRARDATQGTQGMVDDFKLIGASVGELRGKKPGELFDLFVEKMGNIEDPTDRVAAGARILGDDLNRKLMPILARGPEAFDKWAQKARATGNVLDGPALASAEEYRKSVQEVQSLVVGLGRQLAVAVIPRVQEAADEVLFWYYSNQEIIDQGLEDTIGFVVDGLSALFSGVGTVIDIINDAALAFGGWARVLAVTKTLVATLITYQAVQGVITLSNLITGLIATYRALGMAALWAQAKTVLIPAAIAALIVILGLVIEDFQKFFAGQNSAIGELVKKYPKLGHAIYAIRDAFDDASDVGADFLMWLLGPAGEEGTNVLTRTGEALGDFMFETVQSIKKWFGEMFDWAEKKIDAIAGAAGDFGDKISSFFGGDEDGQGRPGPGAGSAAMAVAGGRPPVSFGAGRDLGSRRETNISNNRRSASVQFGDTTFRIEQRPGEDSEEFARRVEDKRREARERELRQAREELDTGVEY